jgi:F-type H+-transporting ATPase subunit b
MEDIINAFGIDVRLIIIQIVNFTILMVVLGYFLYKPILKMLADREAKIKQGITDAEAAAVALSQAEVEKKAILTTAHASAEEVAQRAKAAGEVAATSIVAKAEDEAAQVLKSAALKAEQLRAQVQKEAEAEIAKTAILAAEKILQEKNS